jgi:hypothetical protein
MATPELSREERFAIQSRTYDGVISDDVMKAAQRLFLLADGSDFTFERSVAGDLRAVRSFWFFTVLEAGSGYDTWNLRVNPGGVVIVEVDRHAVSGPIPIMVTGPLDSPAMFDLFWSRMDYLLGRSTAWRTCPEQRRHIAAKQIAGSLEGLCEFTITDHSPDEAAPPRGR